MRRLSRVAIPLIASVLVVRCETAHEIVPRELEELAPAFAYASWFVENTGFDPAPDYFGAYTMWPIGGTLYVGFGAGLPAATDGALLAALDDDGISALATLDEQGVLDMASERETLLVPGVDPCCPDWWEAGNFYTYSATGGFTKWRNLPNVLHAWGIWHDAAAGAAYVATSSHRGDFESSIGEIWRTIDRGASWERIANDENGVGDYRTYDVLGHRGRLYAMSAESRNACTLVAQVESGADWIPVQPDARLACYHRLVSFGGALIAVDSTRSRLQVVTGQGVAFQQELPFTVGIVNLNWAAVVGDYLYAASEDGRVLITDDLVGWQTAADFDQEIVAVQYWPQKGWLVLASRGINAALWKLELCGGVPC